MRDLPHDQHIIALMLSPELDVKKELKRLNVHNLTLLNQVQRERDRVTIFEEALRKEKENTHQVQMRLARKYMARVSQLEAEIFMLETQLRDEVEKAQTDIATLRKQLQDSQPAKTQQVGFVWGFLGRLSKRWAIVGGYH
jgi:hypothetical protein